MRKVFQGIKLFLLALCAISLTWLAFFRGQPYDVASDEAPYIRVEQPVITPERGTIDNTVEAEGSIVSDDQRPAKATAAGVIHKVHVKSDQRVSKGQKILTIKNTAESEPPTDPETPPKPPKVTYQSVTSPIAGHVEDLSYIKGQDVTIGDTVAKIAPGSMHFTLDLNQEQRFRLAQLPPAAKVSITNGPAPFECTDLAIRNSSGGDVGAPRDEGERYYGDGPPEPQNPTGLGTLTCTVPGEVGAFPGLSGTITITTGTASNVMTLPNHAVAGTVNKGFVWTPNPDDPQNPTEVEVQLGLTDGKRIEIKSGLEPNAEVLEFAPGKQSDDASEYSGPYGY